MYVLRIAVWAALLVGSTGLLACKAQKSATQETGISKVEAAPQQSTTKPAKKPDADENEEGDEGPAVPNAAPAEESALQQPAGKQFVYNFDNDTPGKLPAEFHSAKTGEGTQEKWAIVADSTAPSRPNVVAQLSTDHTDYRFPLLISDEGSFKDLDLSVKFKTISGSIDRAAGLVFRLRDANNYYIVRANALEDNYRLYHVVNGRRRQFAGAAFKITAGAWHELRVEVAGDRITCYYDGVKKIEATDDTFKDAGKIGLWTKADSVTYFDDLKVTAR